MLCPQCQLENAATARFCLRCGQPLAPAADQSGTPHATLPRALAPVVPVMPSVPATPPATAMPQAAMPPPPLPITSAVPRPLAMPPLGAMPLPPAPPRARPLPVAPPPPGMLPPPPTAARPAVPPRRSSTARRVLLGVLAGVVLLAAAGGGVYLYHEHQAATGDVVQVPPLPTPGAARTTYTNTRFGYSLAYPTAWHVTGSATAASVHVLMVYNPGIPQASALDVSCAANSNQLDAQAWWQTNQPPPGEQGTGSQTLASGVAAFVARGQGQTAYTVYTVVHHTAACQLVTNQTDQNNAHVILEMVNTFQWQ